jgi:hypothetical protein
MTTNPRDSIQKRIDLVLDETAKGFFRRQFRCARYDALKDAEAFDGILHALERFGSFLLGSVGDLGKYAGPIKQVAIRSGLAHQIPCKWPSLHTHFGKLYELVQNARNDTMHQGAFARHMTVRAIELAIVLEDALMPESDKISHFMVRSPVCAYLWQPVSFVRQCMLVNSFSYLPVQIGSGKGQRWRLISDFMVAKYLRSEKAGTDYKTRLTTTLGAAFGEDEFSETRVLDSSASIREAIATHDHRPVLITEKIQPANGEPCTEALMGILTTFDVL